MSYLHDIFISYRRNTETVTWIQEHFEPLLQQHLSNILGDPPIIYTDAKVQEGDLWPVEIGLALASSRILLCLWSGSYLNSKWCSLELAHMLAREKGEGRRTPQKPSGMVLFAIVHDGDKIPPELQAVQRIDIQNCFNSRMRRDSPRAEELSAILAHSAAGIARAIEDAPPFRVQWRNNGTQQFYEMFHSQHRPNQRRAPTFTGH